MKKILILLVAIVMCISLCACSDGSNSNDLGVTSIFEVQGESIIQKHCEFCTYIGMEIKIGVIEEKELREYARLVMEMNGADLYNNETVSKSSDTSGILLGEIQKKARK